MNHVKGRRCRKIASCDSPASLPRSCPKHKHEWQVWQDVKLPHGKILLSGVASYAVAHVEHPYVIAQRITRFANILAGESENLGMRRRTARLDSSIELFRGCRLNFGLHGPRLNG